MNELSIYQLALLQAFSATKSPVYIRRRCLVKIVCLKSGSVNLKCRSKYVCLSITSSSTKIMISSTVKGYGGETYAKYHGTLASHDEINPDTPNYWEFYESLVTYILTLILISRDVHPIEKPRYFDNVIKLPGWLVDPIKISPRNLQDYRDYLDRIAEIKTVAHKQTGDEHESN